MIISERLKIREAHINDLDGIHSLITDEEVMRFIPLHISQKKQTKDMLNSIIADKNSATRNRYYFVIEEKETNKMIGNIVLKILFQNEYSGNAILGYTIFKEAWGKGFATEASTAMIKYGFNDLMLHRIEASSITLNNASEKVLMKCKMKHEGTKRKSLFHDGIWYDENQYGIIKDEYKPDRIRQKIKTTM